MPATAIPTPKPAAFRATTAAGAPRSGGALTWHGESDPGSLDPHRVTSDAALRVWGDLTYQSLTMFDEKLIVTPALAEAWTNPDPTTWNFTLRRGVRFHDGNELDADDVVFWFERLLDTSTGAPDRRWFDVIEKVERTGTYAVRMRLYEPHAPLLALFAGLRGAAIVSRRAVTGGDLQSKAVGTGPFRITEYVPGDYVRYLKHDAYWERGLPYLDAVTLRFGGAVVDPIGQQPGAVSARRLDPDDASGLVTNPDVRVLTSDGASQLVHHLNVGRKPFDDVRVRRAIALAVDRHGMIERVAGGQARLTGPIPIGHGDWSVSTDRLAGRREVGRARQLLEDAGFEQGLTTTIKVSSTDPPKLAASALLAEQLRDIGIQAEVQAIDPAGLLRALQTYDFDIAADSGGFAPDPDGYLAPRYRSGGVWNFSRWSNGAFDELIDRARTTIEPPERKRLYDQAQVMLLDDVPSIWWFAENQLDAIDTRVRGYVQSLTGRRTFLKTAWIDR